MKRFKVLSILSALLLFLFLLIPMQAQALRSWYTYTLLSNAIATGPGNAVTVYDVFQYWTCDVIHTGGPTTVIVRIEGNLSGSLFGATGMASHTCTATELTNGICSFSIANMGVRNIRANLVTLTAGINPTVTVRCTGVE